MAPPTIFHCERDILQNVSNSNHACNLRNKKVKQLICIPGQVSKPVIHACVEASKRCDSCKKNIMQFCLLSRIFSDILQVFLELRKKNPLRKE